MLVILLIMANGAGWGIGWKVIVGICSILELVLIVQEVVKKK